MKTQWCADVRQLRHLSAAVHKKKRKEKKRKEKRKRKKKEKKVEWKEQTNFRFRCFTLYELCTECNVIK